MYTHTHTPCQKLETNCKEKKSVDGKDLIDIKDACSPMT
jgi:hypothetical protein